MPLPPVLDQHISQLRTEIEVAQPSNWTTFQSKAAAAIDGLVASVEMTPTIGRAADQVQAECMDLADELQNLSASKATIERARETVIGSLDILENVLQRSQPSEQLRAAGKGW